MPALRMRYQTIEFGDVDIHVRTLRDSQQYQDDDGVAERLGISSANWSLFGIVWDASRVLANYMDSFDTDGKRILEIGCGIGLSSLLLNHRDEDITATDYHPEAENFMRENTEINDDERIPFTRTSWADEKSDLGRFDLLIGSDLLYEQQHIDLLAEFIDQHANQQCEVIIVDPGRGQHAKFSKKMVSLGFSHQQHKPDTSAYLEKPFKGKILRYQR
ncbi:MAG: protein N-lysine methyltransferase family protein [Motiliproteus sp.]|nr:protein N-lysine methyltransferase family protein [Motiliproteus sp.]MCW9054000.1 protein N-lysine methyltransferase family protein [Motiliproteus sp.]